MTEQEEIWKRINLIKFQIPKTTPVQYINHYFTNEYYVSNLGNLKKVANS